MIGHGFSNKYFSIELVVNVPEGMKGLIQKFE
jgi:hypothetical protein